MTWQPGHDDPLFILAMDHRDSFGRTLFGVRNDQPDARQLTAMRAAKGLIFDGLREAQRQLTYGRAGVLVDEQYGGPVIDAARAARDAITLAVPIEASGHPWFTLQWATEWIEHIQAIRPDYAKVLVRDNPGFDPADRERQFGMLAEVSERLRELDVPLLYELLVPGTDAQLRSAGNDPYRYDRDLRPALVARVIADNQAHGVEPALWKVEGLETVDAGRDIAAQAKSGGRAADLIVLGRDAPEDRLGRWLAVASEIPAFVGFAIGRSIWEDVIRDFEASAKDDAAAATARRRIAGKYLRFVSYWQRDRK
jgi:myo-inositol catabolism protein IolC